MSENAPFPVTNSRPVDLRDLVAEAYDRCHPRDSFADLERRARFSKEDRRLMEDWIAAVRERLSPYVSGSGRGAGARSLRIRAPRAA